MSALHLSSAELAELLASPYLDETVGAGTSALVVHEPDPTVLGASAPGSAPVVVVGVGASATRVKAFDVALEDERDLDAILGTITAHPVAAATLAVLLRTIPHLADLDTALAAESAAYSALQGGAEFRAWRARATHGASPPDDEPAVLTERAAGLLRIELNRPRRHNAFSRSMRDALCEALAIAVVDDAVDHVELSGRGPSFCSGGDLAEFGSFADPAQAHVTRLTRSPARLMHRLAMRTSVQLHGACMGAGIELAAFAAHVRADPSAQISLPEIGLGLVPGAGGTVSITRRIGRQRCAQLALRATPIDVVTAHGWGLIDEIGPG